MTANDNKFRDKWISDTNLYKALEKYIYGTITDANKEKNTADQKEECLTGQIFSLPSMASTNMDMTIGMEAILVSSSINAMYMIQRQKKTAIFFISTLQTLKHESKVLIL